MFLLEHTHAYITREFALRTHLILNRYIILFLSNIDGFEVVKFTALLLVGRDAE